MLQHAMRLGGALLGLAILSAAGAAASLPHPLAGAESREPAATNVRQGRLPHDGAHLYYEIHGELSAARTPLLVLHGAYMSGQSMTEWVSGFDDRPVIVIDQRGHGRSGPASGPITYERLADDALAVLHAEDVMRADVMGYSMGGGAALQMAIRAPDRVNRLVLVSAGARLSSVYPEILAGIAQITPEVFDGTPIRRDYDRLSGQPEGFASLVEQLKALDAVPFDWSAQVAGLPHQTMIVAGDYDVMRPEHAVELFRLRGGGAADLAAQGILTAAPPARLLILPATSHVGVMAMSGPLISMVRPFLDDQAPPVPTGFF
ncbi:MAG: alpha/beta fold hydrolase [Brevundimonas sp.]